MTKRHLPVMISEVVEKLALKPNHNAIDCNLGYGGHARAILEKIAPDGKLIGIDLDGAALVAVASEFERHPELDGRYRLVHDNFTHIQAIHESRGAMPVHSILFDLGLSSAQLDDEERGFSFQREGRLDMRFNADGGSLTASEILATWSEGELTRIFREYGEERLSKQVAKKIVETRKDKKIDTPSMLVEVVSAVYQNAPFKLALLARGKSVATQVFQALRIAVNDELSSLITALPQALDIVQPGGRMAIISFHSLEDRIVKNFFRREASDCLCPKNIPVCQCGHKAKIKIITKKPLSPTEQEVSSNTRARSAKLRVAEKI